MSLPNNGPRYLQWLLVGVLLLAIVGCGTRFFYNRLDWLVPWYVDDYIELTRSQQKLFDRQLELAWRWHRQNELPRYVGWLNELHSDVADERLSESQLQQHIDRLDRFWDDLSRRLIDDGWPLVSQLNTRQVEELFSNLEKRNQELEKKWRDRNKDEGEEWRQERFEKIFKDWAGTLTKPQQILIKDWARAIKPTWQERLKARRKWQASARDVLARSSDANLRQQALLSLLTQPEQLYSDSYQQQIESNLALTKKLLIELHASLTSEQKRNLEEKIADYIHDFQALIADNQ